MRWLFLASSLVMLTPLSAHADDEDPRAIMQKAAVDQAETTPANVPSKEASTTAKTRADGQQGQLERTTRGASASARRAALSAARAAGAGDPTMMSATIQSTARNANARNTGADANQRSATSVAQEHAVRTGGSGHGGPPTGGRP
jgi:hypothetical protein